MMISAMRPIRMLMTPVMNAKTTSSGSGVEMNEVFSKNLRYNAYNPEMNENAMLSIPKPPNT